MNSINLKLFFYSFFILGCFLYHFENLSKESANKESSSLSNGIILLSSLISFSAKNRKLKASGIGLLTVLALLENNKEEGSEKFFVSCQKLFDHLEPIKIKLENNIKECKNSELCKNTKKFFSDIKNQYIG